MNMHDHIDAIRAGLEYASEAFTNSVASDDGDWRKADADKLGAAWEGWEALDENAEKLQRYLDQALRSFDADPADTDFQRGYREALAELRVVAQQEGWL